MNTIARFALAFIVVVLGGYAGFAVGKYLLKPFFTKGKDNTDKINTHSQNKNPKGKFKEF
jgi:membrane protein DedA with SNARE-associated domain